MCSLKVSHFASIESNDYKIKKKQADQHLHLQIAVRNLVMLFFFFLFERVNNCIAGRWDGSWEALDGRMWIEAERSEKRKDKEGGCLSQVERNWSGIRFSRLQIIEQRRDQESLPPRQPRQWRASAFMTQPCHFFHLMAAAAGAVQRGRGEGGGPTLINIKQAANLLLPINKTFAFGDFRRNPK